MAPKVDFKARAAALKAEQNAEYARGSEDRYKQQAAKAEQERQLLRTIQNQLLLLLQLKSIHVGRNKRDQIRNAMILIVKKMVQENNKGIEIVKIK